MNQRIWLSSEFRIEVCAKCGMSFAMTNNYANERIKDHKSFFCPDGHGQHYTKMSDEEKLQEQLNHCQTDRDFWKDGHDMEKDKRKAITRSRSALRGAFTKLKRRGR